MDRQVERCLSCGHALGIGRFCVNCGHPKGGPGEHSAEPGDQARTTGPATAADQPSPVPPPPVFEPPRPARYPLFADEAVPGEAPTLGATGRHASYPSTDPLPRASASVTAHRRARTSGLWWGAGAVAVVVLFGAGGYLLLNGSDNPEDAAVDTAVPSSTTSVDPSPIPTPPDSGSSEGSDEDPDDEPDGPIDVATLAEATPPDTAPPSRDVNGNAVRYEAFNMLDGQPDTAWRMPGDASGQEIVFRLDSPTTISEVGLINGYAKVDPGYNGYSANRRIESVEWVFGDGTVVQQDLADDLGLQRIPVDGIVADTVTLRIVEVSKPAKGPAGRDYTAISEVTFVGTPE